MAEGFELYHVPQQSRREKLRVAAAATDLHGLITSQLPPPPLQQPYDHRHLIDVSGSSSPSDLMTIAGLGSSSSSNLRNPYGNFDPNLLYGAASQMMHSGEASLHHNHHHQVVVFKPEPLSLSLSFNYNENNNEFGILNDGVSRGSVPLGPFTGYASVLKGSRFLRPAQKLLEELCCEIVGVASPEKLSPDSSLMVMDTNAIVDDEDDDRGRDDHDNDDDGDGHDRGSDDLGVVEIRKKKSRLISMLDEVYRRYKQYYQQMQAVVTSFECVAGLGNAAPYANLAVKVMTRNFRCLKNAIMDQLQYAADGNAGPTKDESFRRGVVYGQMRPTAQHASGSFLDHHQPVWRPQRGLPERAVTVLRAWLFEHFLHPYPTDTDKLMLAKQTGLSRSQVSNWFINARVRLWKPMVEEIHMLETRQAQKGGSQRDTQDRNGNNNYERMPSAANNNNRIPSTSKRSRNELVPNLSAGTGDDVMSLSYDDGDGLAARTGLTNGVSLTLGLHQQDGRICLAEPSASAFSINAAQRFGVGLEESAGSEGYVMNAFEAHQNRHFGGQLLHDFVG